jgi:HK97 gp10 family phage protein
MVLRININSIRLAGQLTKAMGRGAEKGLLRAGLRIEKEARNEAPVDTGSLKSSISTQKKGRGLDTVVTVGPNVKSPEGAPYDVYQEFGTGIYGDRRQRIKPRRAKFLRFRSRETGNVIYAKSVVGVKAKKYMQKGLEATPVEKEFVKGFNAVRR